MLSLIFFLLTSSRHLQPFKPHSGSWAHFAARFFDPALGFAVGWNYWYSYAITLPTEITAAAIVIRYWNTSINVAVFVSSHLQKINLD
jgi:yeast amino acid transporter